MKKGINKDGRKISRKKELVYRGLSSLKTDGVRSTANRVLRFLVRTRVNRRWAKKLIYTEEELEAQRRQYYNEPMSFSIITPLFNTREDYLREMIESVLSQTYPNWELCMADGSDSDHDEVGRICLEYAKQDLRIKYRKLEKNYGIAGNSNACIEMAEGDFISILDHDDVLHPAALHDVMKSVCEKKADFIYTDEITFLESNRKKILNIHFKKDFAPDDLLANNYICHFTSFRQELIDRCGAFREGFDGSQDHDLFLRLTAAAKRIDHIPKPLYYWRAHRGSVAHSADDKSYAGEAGKKAVLTNLEAAGISACVDNAKGLPTAYRVSYQLPDSEPSVSIIIPNCDHIDDLKRCIKSILEKTTYKNYRIIIVENNSRDPALFAYYETIGAQHDNIRVLVWPHTGFNWSAINNYAVRETTEGEYLLFLNNDTEVISSDWIQEMLMHAQRPEVGAVGAMLYFPNDTIQHAGVIIGLGGVAGHVATGIKRGEFGYMSRLCYAQDLSAVNGACLMTRRTAFDKIKGFDENLAVAYNDVDFCLRLREEGYMIVWTPYAELYHYESKSRGACDTPEDRERTKREKALFRCRWTSILEAGDPYYNPNLSLTKSSFEPEMND